MVTPKKKSVSKKSAKKKTVKKKVAKKTPKADATQKTVDETPSSGSAGWYYLAAAIVVVVALIAVFLWLPSQPHAQTDERCPDYNNFDFSDAPEGMCYVRIQIKDSNSVVKNGQILMQYHPLDLEYIRVDPSIRDDFRTFVNNYFAGVPSQVFITVHPDAPGTHVIAGVEVAKVLGEKYSIFNLPTRSAFTTQSNLTAGDVPVVNCWDADKNNMVIWIKEKGESIIAQGGPKNCFVLQANTTNETVKVADRFVYEVLGIMTD